MKKIAAAILALVIAVPAVSQSGVFDLSDVVVGARKIPTRWLFAVGNGRTLDPISALNLLISTATRALDSARFPLPLRP